MKFSYSIIKKLVPRVPSAKVLADALNTHTCEVEEVSGDTLHLALPANRYSDLASHIGIAREAATIFSLPFMSSSPVIVNLPTGRGFLSADIKSAKACDRYIARYFEVPEIKAIPTWMKKAIESCGIQSIHPIVDYMNYVMLETGQPLHAFDADLILGKPAKKIIVRFAEKGELLKTLDGHQVRLDKETLVISDMRRPLAIAGIKGGEGSGITSKTRHIIVEAAHFDATGIFKTVRRLKLITDASLRFSHDISPTLAGIGMDRVTEILTRAGAKLVDAFEYYPRQKKDEIIKFEVSHYESLIGISIAQGKAKKYFQALGFSLEASDHYTGRGTKGDRKQNTDTDPPAFLVRIPAWRTDIQFPEDLIEEIARLEGYGRIVSHPPLVSLSPSAEENMVRVKEKARRALAEVGLDEIYTYSFVSEEDAKMLVHGARGRFLEGKSVALENPIRVELSHMRPSMRPGILESLRSNIRFFDSLGIYEMGSVFHQGAQGIGEKLFVGLGVAAKKKEKVALELKGMLHEWLTAMGLADYSTREIDGMLFFEADHAVIGYLESIEEFKKGWHAAFAEIDCGKLIGFLKESREFRPIAKYPAIMRDVSILVQGDARIGEIVAAMHRVGGALIEDIDLIDEYRDSSLQGKESLTFRIIFQADDRTLTDREVDEAMSRVTSALTKEFEIEIR